MPGTGWLSLVIVTGFVILLVLVWEATVRRLGRQADPSLLPTSTTPIKLLTSLLCVLTGTMAVIWLIPWATFLSSTDSSGLLLGALFLVFLSIGMLYALRLPRQGSEE